MTPNSPFYHPAGYLVMQTLPMLARLKTIAPVDRQTNLMGVQAQISDTTQYDGVPLRMPINSIRE